MYVENLEVKNFRNYELGKVSFMGGTNVIYGRNATGKTNILEAIFITSIGRSHRQSKESELIRFGCNSATIKLNFFSHDKDNLSEIIIKDNQKKQIKINKFLINKVSQLIGYLNVVIFCPEDINIIKGTPSDRRRFLNLAISQIKPNYFKILADYNRVLIHRNKLLKQNANYSDISVWDILLCEYGSQICKYRINYLDEIKKYFKDIINRISKEHCEIKYISGIDNKSDLSFSSFEEIHKLYITNLLKCREKDIKYKQTIVGPHKDDLELYVNGSNAKYFGSQGQKKTLVLALKLSETEIITQITKELPVLLLDDVLSDLDMHRQNFILDNFKQNQVIITCTDYNKFNIINNLHCIDNCIDIRTCHEFSGFS